MPIARKSKSRDQETAYQLTKQPRNGPSAAFLGSGGIPIPPEKRSSQKVDPPSRKREREGKTVVGESAKRNALSSLTQNS